MSWVGMVPFTLCRFSVKEGVSVLNEITPNKNVENVRVLILNLSLLTKIG